MYDTKSYGLPEDIKKHIRKLTIKRILIFVAVFGFCGVIMWYYRADIFPFWLTWRRGILFVVLVIAPFASTRVPFCFFNSNWRGKVEDIKYHTSSSIWAHASAGKSAVRAGTKTIVARSSDSGRKIGYRSRYTVDVAVRREDGSLKRAKVNTFGGAISNYKIGDTVIHFKGLEELLIISAQDDGFLNCVVCGCNNPKTRDNCFGCGHTLLKEYDR